jgi:hypothetical protein
MRRVAVLRWQAAAAVLALAAASGRPAGASLATTVSVTPASGTYAAGMVVQVTVRVDNVTDLYGADVQLTFDPARMEVLDANAGLPGVQVTPKHELLAAGLVAQQTADNTAGTIDYAVTQVDPAPPASGSGALFAFDARMLTTGTVDITVTEHELATKGADVIPADASGASYTIVPAHRVYLPFTSRQP